MFAIKMWLWQAEGPQTGTGSDETFAPGHCLPHSPLSEYAAEKPSLPHHHQSVSDSSWDVSFDGLCLGVCAAWAHLVSKLTHLLKDTNQMQDKTRALPSKESFFSFLFCLASSRRYQGECRLYYLSCPTNIDQAFLQMSGSDFFDIQEEMAVK